MSSDRLHTRISGPAVAGRIRAYSVADPRSAWEIGEPLVKPLFSQRNQIQVGWCAATALCLAGDQRYRIAGMYLEYENTASPGDPVTPPSFDEYAGVDYYTDLALSSDRDYLRVALQTTPLLGVLSGYEDYFPDTTKGNQVSFYSQSQGTAGVHGKAFTAAANSTVFGAALVAMPVAGDPSQDIVIARTYFSTPNQIGKTASRQIGLNWDFGVGLPS